MMELLSTGVSTDTPSCKQPPTSDVTASVGSSTLLSSVHQQLMAGCFGLKLLPSDQHYSLFHYQVRMLTQY